MKYDLVFARANYAFPPSATVDEINAICAAKGFQADVMTDQVDVFYFPPTKKPIRRKVATYMAGA